MEIVKILWLGAVILVCAFVCLVVWTEFRIVTSRLEVHYSKRKNV
jgi:hypothetical protein